MKLVAFDDPGYRYIGYNLKRDLFKDRRVRWALSHAVPGGADHQVRLHGAGGSPMAGPFLPGTPSCDPALRPVSFDLVEARRLLDEAGWSEGPDGIRQKVAGGATVRATFELMIYSGAPAYQTVAEIIKENCRKIGIEVNIAPVEWALMLRSSTRKTSTPPCSAGRVLEGRPLPDLPRQPGRSARQLEHGRLPQPGGRPADRATAGRAGREKAGRLSTTRSTG